MAARVQVKCERCGMWLLYGYEDADHEKCEDCGQWKCGIVDLRAVSARSEGEEAEVLTPLAHRCPNTQ